MTPPTQLERDVMERLLAGPEQSLVTLRRQYEAAVITKRDLTGHGFFLYFSVPEEAACIPHRGRLWFGDVVASVEGLEHGAGFVLLVTDGRLSVLEGYSYDEPWPAETSHYTLDVDANLAEEKTKALKQADDAQHQA